MEAQPEANENGNDVQDFVNLQTRRMNQSEQNMTNSRITNVIGDVEELDKQSLEENEAENMSAVDALKAKLRTNSLANINSLNGQEAIDAANANAITSIALAKVGEKVLVSETVLGVELTGTESPAKLNELMDKYRKEIDENGVPEFVADKDEEVVAVEKDDDETSGNRRPDVMAM